MKWYWWKDKHRNSICRTSTDTNNTGRSFALTNSYDRYATGENTTSKKGAGRSDTARNGTVVNCILRNDNGIHGFVIKYVTCTHGTGRNVTEGTGNEINNLTIVA